MFEFDDYPLIFFFLWHFLLLPRSSSSFIEQIYDLLMGIFLFLLTFSLLARWPLLPLNKRVDFRSGDGRVLVLSWSMCLIKSGSAEKKRRATLLLGLKLLRRGKRKRNLFCYFITISTDLLMVLSWI